MNITATVIHSYVRGFCRARGQLKLTEVGSAFPLVYLDSQAPFGPAEARNINAALNEAERRINEKG